MLTQTLQYDPQLLVVGPAPPPARLDDLYPINMSTAIMDVHKDCYSAIKTHGACVADNNHQDIGRSRGGLTSKIHAVVDTNGLPVHLALPEQLPTGKRIHGPHRAP